MRQFKTRGRRRRALGYSEILSVPLPAKETGNGSYSIRREPRQDVIFATGLTQVDLTLGLNQFSASVHVAAGQSA